MATVAALSLYLAMLSGTGHAQPRHLKIMCLGASITMGQTVNGGYRLPLENELTAAGIDVEFVGSRTTNSRGMRFPNHEGYPGHRIDQIDDGGTNAFHLTSIPVADTLAKFRPDIVLLVCGTNDIVQQRDLRNAPQRMGHLISTILANDPGVTVYVGALPPLRGHDGDVRVFNAAVSDDIARRAATGDNVRFVDMYSILSPNSDFSPDRIHPNAAGYQKMADRWIVALGYGPAAPAQPAAR